MLRAFACSLLLCTSAMAADWQDGVKTDVAKRFPRLERLSATGSMMDALFYRADLSTVIHKRRSELPRDHPLYVAPEDALSADDLVLIRTRVEPDREAAHYVVFSEGPSADPEFYLVSVSDPEADEQRLLFGATIAVIPGDGTILTYGRHNAWFLQRRAFSMRDGAVAETPQPFHFVGVRSTVRRPLTMRTQAGGGDVVAELAAGESVDVLLSAVRTEPGLALLVKNDLGLTGWIVVQLSLDEQELTGLTYLGD